MNPPGKDDYIRYRLEKSKETIEVAELLIQHEGWNTAVNRLYYSVFYAVSALLVRKELIQKHIPGSKRSFFAYTLKPVELKKRWERCIQIYLIGDLRQIMVILLNLQKMMFCPFLSQRRN